VEVYLSRQQFIYLLQNRHRLIEGKYYSIFAGTRTMQECSTHEMAEGLKAEPTDEKEKCQRKQGPFSLI
jgi:hypothetical protein